MMAKKRGYSKRKGVTTTWMKAGLKGCFSMSAMTRGRQGREGGRVDVVEDDDER